MVFIDAKHKSNISLCNVMVVPTKKAELIKCSADFLLIGWRSPFFSKTNKHYSCDGSTKAHAVVVLSTLFGTQKARCSSGAPAD